MPPQFRSQLDLVKKNIIRFSFFSFIVCFISSLNFARYYPIFTDEISFKILYSRYFLDPGKAIFLWPQCKNNFLSQLPLPFIPFRIMESLIYQDLSNLLKIRYLGILFYISYVFAAWLIFRLQLQKTIFWARWKQCLFIISLNSLGTLPYLLSHNRPEAPMVIFLSLTLWLYFANQHCGSVTSRSSWFFQFLLVLGYSGFLSYHPKAHYFAPFFLVVGIQLPKTKFQKGLLLFLLLAITASSFDFWTEQYRCPLDTKTSKAIASVGMSHLSPSTSIGQKLNTFFVNLISSKDYFEPMRFSFVEMEAAGLKKNTLGGLAWRTWNRAFYCFILGIVFISAVGMVRTLFSIAREPTAIGMKTTFLSLGLGLIAHLGITARKAWYDVSFIFPVLIYLFFWTLFFFPKQASDKIGKGFLFFGSLLSFTSLIILNVASYPQIKKWKKGGSISDSYFQVSGYEYEKTNKRVRDLASRCLIRPENRPLHLVVDEISYPSFLQSREPYISVQALSCWGQSQSDQAPLEFLRSKSSAGFIGQCKYLTQDLRPLAKQDEDLCCVPEIN